MKVYYWNNLKEEKPEFDSIAIGNFDGVHHGHRFLIKQALKKDKDTVFVTFESINTKINNKSLTTLQEKLAIFKLLNIKNVLVVFFDEEFKKISAENFENILKNVFKIKNIFCGKDFRYGQNRKGDVETLKKNFKVHLINDKTYCKQKISSTLIKDLLLNKKLKKATTFLKSNYQISGKIIHGQKYATKLGFPTANVLVENKIIPHPGIYATYAYLNDKKYWSVTYIAKWQTNYIETHIFDFSEEIYGQILTVEFIKFIRNDKKFVKEYYLKNQIRKDCIRCFKLFLQMK